MISQVFYKHFFGSPKVEEKIKLTQLCCPWVYLICCLQFVHNVGFLRIETGHVALSNLYERNKLTMKILRCFIYFLSRIFGSLDCLNIKARCVAKTTEVKRRQGEKLRCGKASTLGNQSNIYMYNFQNFLTSSKNHMMRFDIKEKKISSIYILLHNEIRKCHCHAIWFLST